MAIFRLVLPLMGASNAGGVVENRDCRRISGYGIDDCCSANDNCDGRPCSLPHRPELDMGQVHPWVGSGRVGSHTATHQ